MTNSSVVGFVAFALCLIACVSGIDASSGPSGEQKTAVDNAINNIKEVCQKTEANYGNANVALQRVESLNKKEAGEISQVAQALARAEEKAKENREATAIVDNIKTISNMISTLHQNATKEMQNIVASLRAWLSETQTVKDKCDTELLVIQESPNNYMGTGENASSIKNYAENLDNYETFASQITSVVDVTEEKIKKNLTHAEVETLHVSVIVAVTEIKAMMGEGTSIIQETKDKRDNISSIVEEMKNLCTASLIESNEIIKALLTRANDALTNATGAVQNATKAIAEMTEEQQKAGAALNKVKAATLVANAQNEVNTANECVQKGKEMFTELQRALQTTEHSVVNAHASKQKLVTTLSTTTSKPSTEKGKETEKTNLPEGNGTEPNQKDTTIQPTSKELPDQSDNSADKLKDTLIKGVQNVPTTALTGGKAPAPGAKNDSAMTVSVPLLVALIASAVLQ